MSWLSIHALDSIHRETEERWVLQLDVWKGPVAVNRSVDLLLSPTIQPEFAKAFQGANYSMPIADIQK